MNLSEIAQQGSKSMNSFPTNHRGAKAIGGRQAHQGLPRSVMLGALSGVGGTVAMDTLLYLRYRRSGGTQGPLAWEFSSGVEGWDDVSAPGLVGKKLLEKLLDRRVPDRWARSVQITMHWATGIGWSAQFGAVTSFAGPSSWTEGLIFGPIVWLSGYVILPLAKIYEPIWDYDVKTLAKDLRAHLVYGITTAILFTTLAKHARNV